MSGRSYDVVVIGGGHAGVEAAAAASRTGARTLLVTPDLGRIGEMSCNPAIGGVAKGVVAREVDALGGVMGRAADASRIQFRMLNRSKGPAVWGPRAQCDRQLYPRAVRRVLDEHQRLHLVQALVTSLVMEGRRAVGVRTKEGTEIRARAVVVTTGTFLRGRIHVGGRPQEGGGRAGEPATVELGQALAEQGLEVGRFKTGTPPRIDGRSVDLQRLERQDGDGSAVRFSSYRREPVPEQRPCWITWTGQELQEVVQRNLERSAVYGGVIAGQGPRYCPSIEDKVVRFPDAERHQVFLEPEGLETSELYVNGLSTSMPAEVQEEFLRTIPGLEAVRVTRSGYAIEYDYFPPHQLKHSLEVRAVPGLYFAGQINGTTGYEEAAGQGVVAGINSGREAQGRGPLLLERDEAFIGVLVDDLVTKGVDEPYRLFTSRAEFRLLLRQDNALRRLGPRAKEAGALSEEQVSVLERRLEVEERVRKWFQESNVTPEAVNEILEAADSAGIREKKRAAVLVKRPRVPAQAVAEAGGAVFAADEASEVQDALAAVDVELKYEGYVGKERERARALGEQARVRIPEDMPFDSLATVSNEAREKLDRVRPENMAQAGRIPGISPADLQNLLREVRRRGEVARA